MSLQIDWISSKTARYAVEHWHYTKKLPPGKNAYLGVWEDNKLIGALVFGLGLLNHLIPKYGLKMGEAAELLRVALRKHKTPVSRIISISVKILKNKYKNLKLLVSFADSSQGHLGKIYQAGNWIYTGKGGSKEVYVDSQGRKYHSRQVSSSGKRSIFGRVVDVRRTDTLKKIKLMPKYRYLYPLNSEMRMRLEGCSQSYPKRL